MSQPARVVTLPDSGVRIEFDGDYDEARLRDLARRLIDDDELAERMRRAPAEELAEIGIRISEEDRRAVTDEDVLTAIGHRRAPGEVQLGPVAIVIVVVAVINVPQPAE